MDLDAFFLVEGIDEFTIVGIENLPDADRSGPLHLLPSARSVIVFGREIPIPFYKLPPGEKTQKMLHIAETLDRTAAHLADLLIAENFRSAVVPLFLPVRVVSGRIQGIVRLKQIAVLGGLGMIGKNTILISLRYGNRLVFAGIVTEMEAGLPKSPLVADFCGNCGRCVRACPGGAIGSAGVNAFRCRNISPWIPATLVPAATWLMSHDSVQRFAAPFISWISRYATMRCNLCVTVCPYFLCRGTGEG